MNALNLQSAYMVIYAGRDQSPIETRYTNIDLLTARKDAMSYAEWLFYRLGHDDDTTQIEVYLIEQENSESNYNRVARVLRRQCYQEPDLYSSVRKSGTELRVDLARCLDNLAELYKEEAYYNRHHHPTGFGVFRVIIRNRNNDVLSKGLILWDALGYAQATVDCFANVSAGMGWELYIRFSKDINREAIDSVPIVPGYVVEVQSEGQNGSNPTKTFLHVDLSMARHEAFRYAQQRANQQQANREFVIRIYLAEFDGEQVIGAYIAQIFTHHFHDESRPEERFAEIAKEFPDIATAHERFASPLALWKSLGDMTCEYDCYTSLGHPSSFGFVKLNLQGPLPFHFKAFLLLYDGLAYAVSLIERYNRHYGKASSSFSYSVEDLLHTHS